MNKQYRIRERYDGFVLELFREEQSCPKGYSPSGKISAHWEFVESFKNLQSAEKQRDLIINPVYH